jgi:hypothetical protein
MQRLNIPLSRHQKTTRRPRWVVWITIGFLAIALFIVYYMCLFWFTRPVLAKSAPSGTEFAVRLIYKNSTSEEILKLIKNIPLVTNRSLTIEHIEPYLSGDLMIFVGSDMSRSVAFRAKNVEELTKVLDAYKITKTEISRSTVLISEKLVAVEGMETSAFFSRNTLKFQKRWMGDIFINSDKVHAGVFSNSKRYEVVFPFSNKHNLKTQKLPENTVAFLSLPAASQIDVDLFVSLFSSVSSILQDSMKIFAENLVQNKGLALVSADDKGVGFLVSSEKKLFSTSNFSLNNLLQSISALNSPKIITKQLPDGTISKELVADPDIVSVEEYSLSGQKILRTQSGASGEILGLENDELFRISNREELVRFYSDSNKEEGINICGSSSLGLDLEKLSMISSNNSVSMSNSLLFPLSEGVSQVGLVNKKYSTRLYLCK